MYCPQCNKIFDDGWRQFCPTDQARLLPEAAEAGSTRAEAFSNVPEIDVSGQMEDDVLDIPPLVGNEPGESAASHFAETNGDFFEFEIIEPETSFEQIEDPLVPDDPTDVKPETRKVNPNEIPAGHVELEKPGRNAESADFRADDPESFVGRTVKGRYYVTEFLGGEESSFAYLGYDKIVRDKTVLVRILSREGGNEVAESIIDDELVRLSHVSHPNVARLIDSGHFTDKTRFLISEYVDALSVNELLSIHGVISPSRAARIIRQVAYALNEIHQEGIVHRDLRPENIIIAQSEDESERAVLVNFGASNGEPNGRNLGYKSPEVFDGRLSTSSGDIFSLAVVAFEMLTGVLPFDDSKPNAMVRSQYAGLQRLPSQIRRELRSSIDHVFEKALAFNVADRYIKARDLGDAFFNALTEAATPISLTETKGATGISAIKPEIIVPPRVIPAGEPVLKELSSAGPQIENQQSRTAIAAGIIALLLLLGLAGYYVSRQAAGETTAAPSGSTVVRPKVENTVPRAVNETELPPPKNVPQPPNTNVYQNNKIDLKGDLLRNFVGFTLYYPKDWTFNGPRESGDPNLRGKFLDISRSSPEGRLKEQMLVSYYQSRGTFQEDSGNFPRLAEETNQTLTKLLPGYKMVSEGEITVNGRWRAYEVKFQGSGTANHGEKIEVWGRRLFIPVERPGVSSGFEITMLATSASDDVHGVNDVGVKGELGAIFNSFEPDRNF